tara:strand:+ start:607 stop:1059 length:453 start_codon:yes stop_codon:yes gene_type:complete
LVCVFEKRIHTGVRFPGGLSNKRGVRVEAMNSFQRRRIGVHDMHNTDDVSRLMAYTHHLYSTAKGMPCSVLQSGVFLTFKHTCLTAVRTGQCVESEIRLPQNIVMLYRKNSVEVFRVESVHGQSGETCEGHESTCREAAIQGLKRKRIEL